jgi:hypothetical protein
MLKKNMHLVPVNIQDIADKINDPTTRDNELQNYIMRLEAVRDFCNETITKAKNEQKKRVPAWKVTREYCS